MILLCELLGPDPFRHHRNQSFPFLLGLCRHVGRDASWITMGVEASGAGGSDRFFIDLDERARARLERIVRERGIDRVVFNESIDAGLARHLFRTFPALDVFCLGDIPSEEQGRLIEGSVADLLPVLGLPGTGGLDLEGLILDEIVPAYDREPLADTPLPKMVFLRVLAGQECAHVKPIATNPHFAGIDLSSASHQRGCTFCQASRTHGWPWVTEPLDLAFRQIARAIESVREDELRRRLHSLESGQLLFLIQSARAFLRLDAFLERLEALNAPPSAFLFSCRADELLSRLPTLEQRLPRLKQLGHAVHVWVMGVENFSPEENERLNKHITAEQVLEAGREMARLERELPDAFCFSRHGGFSFILFTPWTSIEDLRCNISWARRVGISPASFFLRSRLQLVEGRPVSLLAKRDGLIVERFSEPYFDSGCIQSHHDEELSWRFRHPEVAVVYRIASRLPPEVHDLAEEDLYAGVQEAMAPHYARGLDAFDALEALLDAMDEAGGALDFEAALRRTTVSLESSSPTNGRSPDDGASLRDLSKEEGPLRGVVATLEAAARRGEGKLLGYDVAGAHLDGTSVRLDLTAPEDPLFQIFIEPRVAGRSYLGASASHGVGYLADTPPHTDGRRALMRGLGRLLSNPDS